MALYNISPTWYNFELDLSPQLHKIPGPGKLLIDYKHLWQNYTCAGRQFRVV